MTKQMIDILNMKRKFVAFHSFFPYNITVFHKGRQQKSGGRQCKRSRADNRIIVSYFTLIYFYLFFYRGDTIQYHGGLSDQGS